MTPADLLRAGAAAAAAAVQARRVTALAMCEAALDAMRRENPRVNAFTDVTAERGIAAAVAVDQRLDAGEAAGPLAGVPYAVKNLFDIAGVTTRAGSKINRDNAKAATDAVLVQRLDQAGATLLGALNMGEYAYDFTGENAHDGPSRNPHDASRMTGGSSGGTGAAVAAAMVPLALGSDTNGSIRVPAALCGVCGLKPTYGRLPRTGSFPFVHALDHVGPLARRVADLALAYDAMQGFDAADPVSADRPVEPTLPVLERGLGGLAIAVAGGYFREGAHASVLAGLDAAAAALGARETIDLPLAPLARAAAFLITTSEGAALHLERLRARPMDFDPETRDRFLAGALVPAAWVNAAQKIRAQWRDAMRRAFARVDVILAPTVPVPAPPIGAQWLDLGGQLLPLRPSLGLYTQPFSAIGLPVAAVPAGTDPATGLPVGVQIIAAPWREDHCLRVAAVLEARMAKT
jgi:aspartyl-tRNA(Asn)/glutamyl-tRNA(Gln) amidotransferase subunit A